MQTRTRFWICGLALLCLTPTMALGDHKTIRGRTGLPLVRDGAGNIVPVQNVVERNRLAQAQRLCRRGSAKSPLPHLFPAVSRVTTTAT